MGNIKGTNEKDVCSASCKGHYIKMQQKERMEKQSKDVMVSIKERSPVSFK